MGAPIISTSVKVYNSDLFGDGIYLTTATELYRGLKNAWGEKDRPSREECAAQLTDLDDYLNQFDEDEIADQAQSLINEMNMIGWGKGKDWLIAKRYLKKLAK